MHLGLNQTCKEILLFTEQVRVKSKKVLPIGAINFTLQHIWTQRRKQNVHVISSILYTQLFIQLCIQYTQGCSRIYVQSYVQKKKHLQYEGN